MAERARLLAVVPARGSKRLPRKNLIPLAGRPDEPHDTNTEANWQEVEAIAARHLPVEP